MASAVAWSAALTLLVGRSALGPGYLLQVDAAFGPKAPPFIGGFYAPVWVAEKVSVMVVGGAATGRIYLFGVVFLAGFLPMVLLRRQPWFARLFAGALGVLNPWTYDRLVEGQWTVVAACDGLLLWLICWELLDRRPTWARALGLALATFVVVSFYPGFAGILLVLAAACVIGARSWRSRRRLGALATAAGMSLVALVPGAVLFLTGHGPSTASQLSRVTSADLHFFRPAGASHLGLLDLFGLYGYWGERLGRFPVATGGSSWWILATAVLVALAFAGAVVSRRRAWLLVSGYFGIIVSLALATTWGSSFFARLAAHLTLLRGYREPEKWSALWLVALVVLGATALGQLRKATGLPRVARAAIVVVACAAVVVPAGVTTVRGTGSVLTPVRYPQAWYAAARYLASPGRAGSTVMVLPWHLYEALSFSGGRQVENPGQVFFPGHVLSAQSDDILGDAPAPASPERAEEATAPLCSLSRLVRTDHVQVVVVEPAPGAANDVSRLSECGMVRVVDAPSITVLAWSTR